jgi:hypothetical protein
LAGILLPLRHEISFAAFALLGAGLGAAVGGSGSVELQLRNVLPENLREHEVQMRAIDEDTIKNYLVRNNLMSKATRTNSGLYVVTLTEGQGPQVTTGKQVRVKYIGRFLSNGAHPSSSGYRLHRQSLTTRGQHFR